MISNVNIGTTITTVLQPPANSRYAVHFVHFCNTSDSDSEVLTIYLSHNPVSVSTVIKEVTVPPGETFVFGTSKNLSNVVNYLKVRDNQVTYLANHELLAASSSGTNIVATANYAEITIDKTQELVQPSPTPTPSNSYNLTRKQVCGCGYNTNDSWQQTTHLANVGTRWFYIHYNDVASPHSNALGGSTIFKVGQCIYYNGTSNGQPVIHWNKVTEVFGPFYMSNTAYYKIHLEETSQATVPAGEKIYVCDSVNPAFSPTPTPSITPTITVTPTITPTISVTPTATVSPSVTISTTPSITPSVTATPTVSVTPTVSSTPSATISVTPSITPSVTVTPTISVTPTVSPSVTASTSITPSITVTPSISPSMGVSVTPSPSVSVTPSVTPSTSATPSVSVTPSASITPSVTVSSTPSVSITATPSVTPSISPSASISPSITPSVTPSASALNTQTAEYCKPFQATIFNIIAFIPNGLQANGIYDFDSGSINTLSSSARNFKAVQISNYNWASPLFELEMVSEDNQMNLQTWKWTFTNWPRPDGSLEPITTATSAPQYISEATKSKSSKLLRFDFEGNGSVIVTFKDDNCSGLINNNCSNVEKPENYYLYDRYMFSIANPSLVSSEINVLEDWAGFGSEVDKKITLWSSSNNGGTVVPGGVDGTAYGAKMSITPYDTYSQAAVKGGEFIKKMRSGVEVPYWEITSPHDGVMAFQWRACSYGGGVVTVNVYVNGILSSTAGATAQFGTANCNFGSYNDVITFGVNVAAGDLVEVKMVPLGWSGQLQIISGTSQNNFINTWIQTKVSDNEVGDALGKMTTIQATNFIKSILAAKGIQYNDAVKDVYQHLGGLRRQNVAMSDMVGGGKPITIYYFRDLFYIRDNYEVGDTILNIYQGRDKSLISTRTDGTVVAKIGNLYVLDWNTSNPNEYNKRRLSELSHDPNTPDWDFINYDTCTEGIFTPPPASPAVSPTPSPTPSASAVTVAAAQGLAAKNNPHSLRATNIGPWTGNRSGYKCPTGGTYGNGYFMWPLTNPLGSFPYWSGTLFEMRCLSAADSDIQTWQFVGKGWNYCQGPTYTSTGTKAYHEDSVTFTMGAGTFTVYFKE